MIYSCLDCVHQPKCPADWARGEAECLKIQKSRDTMACQNCANSPECGNIYCAQSSNKPLFKKKNSPMHELTDPMGFLKRG